MYDNDFAQDMVKKLDIFFLDVILPRVLCDGGQPSHDTNTSESEPSVHAEKKNQVKWSSIYDSPQCRILDGFTIHVLTFRKIMNPIFGFVMYVKSLVLIINI